MKNVLIVFLLGVFCFQINAQTEELEWFTNIDAAKEYATAHKTNIMMVFAGSDWCKPCIQFKKDILEAADFQKWGKNKLIILYLDFPARKKNKLTEDQTAHNEALAERFNKSGIFPNILLMNNNEKILANPKFKNQSPAQFVHQMDTFLTAQK